jgi:hypothetical protein
VAEPASRRGLEVAEKADVLPLIESMTPAQAEAMLSVLRGPLPTGESDVPADTEAFAPEPPAEGDGPEVPADAALRLPGRP